MRGHVGLHAGAGDPQDKSNGYEEAAEKFMCARSPHIGAATVRQWTQTLPRGSSILDLGCGHGVPISQVLIDGRFALYGVDASAKMIRAFGERFPAAHAECSPAEDSDFFHRTFDGVVAWGLLFLLPTDVQTLVFSKVAGALSPGGQFLFTSPEEPATWRDALTARESISLGIHAYRQILRAEGLILAGQQFDEGGNHYYFVSKPWKGGSAEFSGFGNSAVCPGERATKFTLQDSTLPCCEKSRRVYRAKLCATLLSSPPASDLRHPHLGCRARVLLADLAFFSRRSFHAVCKAPASRSSLAAASRM